MKKFAAEFTGTFIMVLIGTGAIALDQFTGQALGGTIIALAFGLGVWLAIVSFAPASGAHINPAVSIALYSSGKLPAKQLPVYLSGQMLGGIAASAVIAWLYRQGIYSTMTLPHIGVVSTFFLELGLTFLLMCAVVIAVKMGSKALKWTSILIALVVVLEVNMQDRLPVPP